VKSIYIAGAGGMLGAAFYRRFSRNYRLKCTDIDVNENWLEYLDFRDLDAYKKDVKNFGADYLFHLGALTDLEYCELHPDEAYLTNTISVENAVYIANELDIPMLYISTAGIFDGSKEAFDDWDQPNPLGVYARSKWLGEQLVLTNARNSLVCRAGWMMGGGPQKDKKFIQKLMIQIKAGKRELFIVNDKLGTPTYTHDFARNVEELLSRGYWGLYNMVCSGVTDRMEVATTLIQLLGIQNEVGIKEVPSDYFKKQYFAPRPSSERLINRKLRLRNMDFMRNWKVALEEYLKTSYEGYLLKKDQANEI